MGASICHICATNTAEFARVRIMNKYEVRYDQCPRCGFVQTEKPYWLNEAYMTPISGNSIGLATRNRQMSEIVKTVLAFFFGTTGKYLDYGGGYGLFTRMMRDAGFRFYHYDLYCKNRFAAGFEADLSSGETYELLTSFELFEHLPEPVVEIGEMLKLSDSILFSTELLPPNNPRPGEWWYYALDEGKHISFYTLESLEIIAERFGMNFYTNGSTIHLLTKRSVQPILFETFCRHEAARALSACFQLPSLLGDDYAKLTSAMP